MILPSSPILVQTLSTFCSSVAQADVLRLDTIHPIVSGNKWYKLKYLLQDAITQNKNTIATFGGAFSNHIVATAFACKAMQLKSIGIIRGEQTKKLSHTLQQAVDNGMQLVFVSREQYRQKKNIVQQLDNNLIYWIDEGGYSELGMKGASEILNTINIQPYSHIFCSCGTGTMVAGIINSALPTQYILAISAIKNNLQIEENIANLLPKNKQLPNYYIHHQYHFGGYAKHPTSLINFMNELYQSEKIPTDIVYTAKLLYAVQHLCTNNFFTKENKLLIIHSGGLQGNLSLPPKTLIF